MTVSLLVGETTPPRPAGWPRTTATGRSRVGRWLLAAVALLGGYAAQAQSTVVIGTTTLPVASSNNTFYGPIYRFSAASTNNYSRYAHLYTAAELGIPAGSTITAVAWLKSDASTAAGANTFNVLLKSTTDATLTSGTTWASLITGATSTYSSTAQAVTGAAGTYFAVPFSTNFIYNGGNLLVLSDWFRGGTTSNYLGWVPNLATGLGIGSPGGAAAPATLLASNYGDSRPTVRITFTAPACTGTPTAGTTVASVTSGCGTVTSALSLNGATVANGITYQWQQSSTGTAGSYSNVASGGTSSTYSATGLTSSTYFQAILTCSGQSATSTPVQVVVNSATPTYATLPVTEGFESWVSRCDNTEAPGVNWRTTPLTGDNAWRRNDQGYTTAGWRYINDDAASYPAPTASQGTYSARFHSYGTAVGGQGSLDLFADLSAAGTKTLTFDYFNASGTDKLEVLLSTDGGVTFGATPLLTLGAAAAFGGQSVTFTATSATSVIRFRATSDFANDDIGIDRMLLQVTPSCPGVAFSPTTGISSTGATVNFTGVPAGTSYSLTYSPGGTTPQTVSAGAVPLTGLLPYTLYTVTVTTNCGGGQTGTAGTSFRTAIGNDECAGAVALTTGAAGATCAAQTYTTEGATASTGVTSPCTTLVGGDVWFSFVASGPRHTITVVPTFDFDAVIELRGGTCPGTSIKCQNASASGGGAGTEALVATGLTAGTTYLVRVYSAIAGSSNNFDICVTTPSAAACAAVTGAAAGTITTTTAVLSFTAAAGATDYFLTLSTGGNLVTSATLTGSPVNLNGLLPGTAYVVTVETNCTNGGVSAPATVNFSTLTPPMAPANDNCAGATSLTPSAGATCTSPSNGTTAGATSSGVATTCGGNIDDDVWYSFVATATTHTITVVGSTGFDAVIDLRSGACASSTNLRCQDATLSGGTEVLAATGLTAGTTYLVRVYDYATGPAAGTGAFTICVTSPTPVVAPANDNCVAATALTPGAAGAACATPTTGNTTGATSSGVATTCGGNADDDVWYSFVATATAHTITVAGSTNFDAVIDLRGGACASSTNLQCEDNTVGSGTEVMAATGLTVGTTYLVRVYHYGSGSSAGVGTGAFTICITTPGALTNLVVSTAQTVGGPYNNVTVTSTGSITGLTADLDVSGVMTVQSGGSVQTDAINYYIRGTGRFVLDAGATLVETNSVGITNTGTGGFLLTGTNPVQLSPDANYVFGAASAQVTGVLLPVGARNLTVNNQAGLTLTRNLTVAQVVRLQNGSLSLNGRSLLLPSSAAGTALVDNSGGGTVIGATASMQRAITGGASGAAYRQLSSPVTSIAFDSLRTGGFTPLFNGTSGYNTSATPGTATPFPTVYGYDQSRLATATSNFSAFDKGWYAPQDGSVIMVPNRGFTVNAPATASPFRFTGTLNTDTQGSGTLSRGTDAAAGWQLLGNPYPSPLDWSTVAANQRVGMDAAMYVFRSTGQYAGNYRAYANGIGPDSPIIEAGSGYFVRVTTPGSTGAVNLTNANRVTTFGNPQPFGRGQADGRAQVHLQLHGAALTDDFNVYLQTGATAGVDAEFDAVKLPNPSGLNLSSVVGNERLAIDGRPLLTATTVVPLWVGVPAAGTYTFEAAALLNMTTPVYLHDATTGQTIDLRTQPRYSFTTTATTVAGRFSLQLAAAGPLANATALTAAEVSVYPNPAHASFTVQLPAVAGAATVQAALLNVLGQVVRQQSAALPASGARLTVITTDLATGVYTLRLQAGGATITKRVVIQ